MGLISIIINSIVSGIILNIFFGFLFSIVGIDIESKIVGNTIVAVLFIIPLIMYIMYRNSPNIDEYNVLKPKKNEKKSAIQSKPTSFELDSDGNFKIISFEKNPMEILVKLTGKPRREFYKIKAILMDKEGNYLFQCDDEFNKKVNFYYYQTASLITFNNQAYHTFDELILAMTNKKFLKKFEQLRNNYLSHLQNKTTSK
ncbi:hypothetical protein ACWIUA_00320 [Ursidibacter sp. B-7004-1]